MKPSQPTRMFQAIAISLAGISAFPAIVSAASSQDNSNQQVLEQNDIDAHAWHTGAARKLVFKGNPVSMENPGGDPDYLIDGDRIYVYTSTDANQRKYRDTAVDNNGDGILDDSYLDMDGYTVWSSEDMIHWTNHGVQFAAVNMDGGKWAAAYDESLNMSVNTTLQVEVSPRAMWAPTAAKYSDGTNTTYVLYYPKGIDGTNMFATGYATAPTPFGPFVDQGPLYGDIDGSRFLMGMDPNVFQDDADGKIYIYGNGPTDHNNPDSPGQVVVAQLSAFNHANQSQSIISEPQALDYDMNNTMYDGLAGNRFSDTDFHEGGSMHKSNGKYYFSWAEHDHKHYNGWYSMCNSPMGPCEWMGPVVKGIYYGNQHGSFVEFKGKEYFLSHIDHNSDVKSDYEWDSYRRTWTFYPVTYNADKSIRVMYPDASMSAAPSINIGGTYTDASGTSYIDSTHVTAGDFVKIDSANAAAVAEFENANPGLTDPELYKAKRVVWDGPLNVSVPLADGVYTVTLKFAELFADAAVGSRVMDIFAEGTARVTGLDVLGKAGLYGAHDETFTINVDDGLDLRISATSGYPMLSAVKIAKQADWAVNLGGAQLTAKGDTYAADPGAGNFNDNTTETITLNANEVIGAEASEEGLFQTSRIGWAGLNYSNSALANGNYEVTLGFVETYHASDEQRVFDVEIENILVLDNFDIHKATGGKNIAVKRVFPVKLSDGMLNIDLTTVVDASKISFIKVVRLADDVLDSSIRLNAGNFWSDTDTEGAYFLTDVAYLLGTPVAGSTKAAITREDLTYTGIQTLTPTDEAIYQTERWGSSFGYAIPVRNGKYRVRLMFVEQYHSEAEKREFTISIEGYVMRVGRDPSGSDVTILDIFRAAGGKNKALDLFYEIDVTDGELNIDLNKITDNASISGIVVTPDYLKKNTTTSDPAIWEAGYRDDQL